jgi:hypothetical protein
MAYATRRSYAGAAPACTLTNSITSGDTSASLTGDVTNWTTTASGPFFMVIDPGLSTEEKVLVAARTGSSLSSITRGQDGTTAASHAAGATCYPVFTATDADQANKVASTLTTKGDILATDGSVLNRLAVGTDRKKLTADTAETNGIKWQYEGELTLNAQTGTTYTLVLTDSAKFVTLSNASAIALSIPTNASVAFPTGTQVNIVQLGAGQVTVGGAGVTIRSQGTKLKLNGQYSAATCIKIGTDEWVLVGNTAA